MGMVFLGGEDTVDDGWMREGGVVWWRIKSRSEWRKRLGAENFFCGLLECYPK